MSELKVTYYISNEQEKIEFTPETEGLIKSAILAALEYEAVEGEREISVPLTDNETIHQLNKEYRDVDRPTDVLSFPMDDDGEDMVLGDVVISLEKAMEQAEEYGHSLEREIAFLCVHSVLHLLGYDHETGEEDEKEMFRRQEEILRKMGQTR